MTNTTQDNIVISTMILLAVGSILLASFALRVPQVTLDLCVDNTNKTLNECVLTVSL